MKIRIEVRHSERDRSGKQTSRTSVLAVDTDVLTGNTIPGWDGEAEAMTQVLRMPMTGNGHSLDVVVSREN